MSIITYRLIFLAGTLKKLKHIKRDITEAVKGSECGMSFDEFQDFVVGDKIQSFRLVEKERKIE